MLLALEVLQIIAPVILLAGVALPGRRLALSIKCSL